MLRIGEDGMASSDEPAAGRGHAVRALASLPADGDGDGDGDEQPSSTKTADYAEEQSAATAL